MGLLWLRRELHKSNGQNSILSPQETGNEHVGGDSSPSRQLVTMFPWEPCKPFTFIDVSYLRNFHI